MIKKNILKKLNKHPHMNQYDYKIWFFLRIGKWQSPLNLPELKKIAQIKMKEKNRVVNKKKKTLEELAKDIPPEEPTRSLKSKDKKNE
ncbi:MAG: hypothetical protein IAX21_03575 [Candidatus Bathyarchaeota archaeon]|nr:MAG: hypothetical protein IAX21_03575 [Candidatus Bathyarchaeota archaeon]